MNRSDATGCPDEELEQIREVYRALGPGFPAEAQRLFDPDAGDDGDVWCVKVFGRSHVA